MNSQKEYDHLFSDLKKAGRPPAVRHRTLEYILANSDREISAPPAKRPRVIPAFISIAAVAIALFLVFSVMNDSPAENGTASAFADIDIEQSLVAETNNTKTFKATLPLQMNVRSVEDPKWNRSLKKTLAGAELIAEMPETRPAFDLSIYTKQQSFRFKVWDNADALVLWDMDSDKVYSSTSEDAANFISMLKNMYGQ
ncbi:hypothetical protein [Planococcus sp. CAU13]|uniref:hypothetical protein n=1 Tax=Planococcus sp. CAU13 TaxID=1541197 RepID=UPI00052FFAAA|nr:hypothetical protein [Planococcus sp. CAU13]